MTTRKPKLALVGRPNVGKSALFNRISHRRLAIVDEAEGITRDRLYADAELFGFDFEVIDTGGIDPQSKAIFNEEIKRQAEIAIEEADSLIMVVDSRIGVTALDMEVAKILHKSNKPLCVAINKVDNVDQDIDIYTYYQMGIERIVPVSAEHGHQIAELLEIAFQDFDKTQELVEEPEGIKVAIVGKPNVGKSSLLNTILEEERCCVSPIAGTTRDSIDAKINLDGDDFVLIDTAGIRRKGAEHEVVDKFAAIRTKKAIERSDVCLLMLDAREGISAMDKKIANLIEEKGKGCIILINKWDLFKGVQMEHYLRAVRDEVPFLAHCPALFISALTGRNLDKIFVLVKEVYANAHMRITTHQLNNFLADAMQRNHPPMITGKRLRIYYMAQVGAAPPTFVMFVNYPKLMTGFYKKYLYNQFRKQYKFTGVPIPFYLKGKKKGKGEARESSQHS
ncbi:MAG: GTPase Der [Chlamydiae bacterium]|nr:GTPase Der [Chlamydiota bacterium]